VDTLADLRQRHRRAVVRSHLTTDLAERAALQASAALAYDRIYDCLRGGGDVLEDNELEYAGVEDDIEDVGETSEDEGFSGAVLVLLVEGEELVEYTDGDYAPLHCTVVFLGDMDDLGPGCTDHLVEAARHIGASVPPFSASPVSAATFGDEDVHIIEAPELASVRSMALAQPDLADAAGQAEHPLWLPHVSGLDDREDVRFDRVGAWLGDDRTAEFPLVGPQT
jgi:hypothetical protein